MKVLFLHGLESSPGGAKVEHLEGLGKQGIPGQDRVGFPEQPVAGRNTAAEVIIIHGWQVIVDQGVGMDHFHRTCRRKCRVILLTAGPRSH